jgi:hypothetical protein
MPRGVLGSWWKAKVHLWCQVVIAFTIWPRPDARRGSFRQAAKNKKSDVMTISHRSLFSHFACDTNSRLRVTCFRYPYK